MGRALVAALALLGACAPEVPCEVTPAMGVERAWCADARPVLVVQDCDPQLVRDAAALWGELGALELERGPTPAPGREQPGRIYLRRADVPDVDGVNIEGNTERYWRTPGFALQWARIDVERCELELIAHEIGHALGFGHEGASQGDVMAPRARDRGPVVPDWLAAAYDLARGR